MGISKKQKDFIIRNKEKLGIHEIAKSLKLTDKEVKEFVASKHSVIFPGWFKIVLTVIPILFFILLETGLRIFSYGRNDIEWIDITEDYQILNPEIGYRYFSNLNSVPFPTESFVKKTKAENSFRIFVLGESSAAGYPYHNSASFSKYIRKGLEFALPDKSTEVVNVGMAAINSYTILDLLPGILEKKPDLILIYTGHNEYYGALGVGSTQSYGSSPLITRTLLVLNKFKTFELVNSIINSIFSSIKTDASGSEATLMVKMAEDKLIAFNSEKYFNGIEQFENNLDDILKKCKEANVPVILGTLISNLKNQKPFNSVKEPGLPAAIDLFTEAKVELDNGNIQTADSLFRYAKDLDALRFRAPEEINKVILRLAGKYDYSAIRLDSLINSSSNDGIVGDEFMTDHLHPNVEGYQLIGRFFLQEMMSTKPGLFTGSDLQDIESIDKNIKLNYNFTSYDSTVAEFRIKILKSDWPFSDPLKKIPRSYLITPRNLIDSLALQMIDGLISRETARLRGAANYIKKKQFEQFAAEMYALTEEFPFQKKYYEIASTELIRNGSINIAYSFLEKGYKKYPDAFTSKWLGIINLSRKNYDSAVYFLEKSLEFNSRDAQVLYNLAGAYSDKKDYRKAINSINKCLAIEPDFPNALQLKSQLDNILK